MLWQVLLIACYECDLTEQEKKSISFLLVVELDFHHHFFRLGKSNCPTNR